MPNYTINVPTGVPASAALADLPSRVKALLKRGFEVVGRVPAESLDIFADAAKDVILEKDSEDSGRFPEVPGLNRQDAAAALSVATMIASFLNVESADYGELIEAAVNQELLETSARERALDLGKRLDAYRSQISAEKRRLELANETLPSFRRLSASVDLRIRFEREKIAFSVPVVVAHVWTDAAEDIWFQMTEDDVAGLIAHLQRLLKQMQVARQSAPGDRKDAK